MGINNSPFEHTTSGFEPFDIIINDIINSIIFLIFCKNIHKISILFLCFLLPCIINAQIIATVAGNGSTGNTGDGGPATAATVYIPSSGVFDKNGNYYFCVSVGAKVRKISPLGYISSVAGNGTAGFSGDGGPATNAQLNMPGNVSIDTFGNLYITDGINNRIRKVNISTGIISTIVGNSTLGFGGDGGPATNATIHNPVESCFDKYGNFYFADGQNLRVRKINTAGIISTFAGTGSLGTGGMGGPATGAQIQPVGVCSDKFGNIYIADNTPSQTRVCKVNTSGIITLVAGNPFNNIYNGDGIPATDAYISPFDITLDSCENLYIADVGNNRIRMVDADGIIHTVVGNGIQGFNGDNIQATTSELYWPYGIAIDSSGNLFITDSYNYRVRKVSLPHCTSIDYVTVATFQDMATYPNPTNDLFHIDNLNKRTSYNLLNIIGVLVKQGILNEGNNIINLRGIPSGIYLLEVIDDGQQKNILKIIKQ